MTYFFQIYPITFITTLSLSACSIFLVLSSTKILLSPSDFDLLQFIWFSLLIGFVIQYFFRGFSMNYTCVFTIIS